MVGGSKNPILGQTPKVVISNENGEYQNQYRCLTETEKIHGKEKEIRKLKISHISQVLTSFAKLCIN